MKVPARRRGSIIIHRQHDSNVTASMKVPARRRGNELVAERSTRVRLASMKVPARRRGNGGQTSLCNRQRIRASMKVPARRRGNHLASGSLSTTRCLNESPARKRGNAHAQGGTNDVADTSMKVPARWQGNKSIPKQPFKHLNTIDKPKHHASDTPTLRHVPGSRGDRQSLQGHYPHLYYQSAIELVIPPLPCRASLANEQHAPKE